VALAFSPAFGPDRERRDDFACACPVLLRGASTVQKTGETTCAATQHSRNQRKLPGWKRWDTRFRLSFPGEVERQAEGLLLTSASSKASRDARNQRLCNTLHNPDQRGVFARAIRKLSDSGLRAAVLLGFVTAGLSHAASLHGTVKDPQGHTVPGATITLLSRTGVEGTTTTTDAAGSYQFDNIAQGEYILRATSAGFATYLADDVRLTSTPRAMDIALPLAGLHQEVVVTASSTPQTPETVSKETSVIDASEARERNAFALTDVVAFTPGVRVEQLGGTGAFSAIQIRGMRDQDMAVLVDGLRLRDAAATQGDASGLIEDLLFTNGDRVEVLQGSGSSLYGTNAIGGVVNVITDEGGGRTRGSFLAEGGSLGTFRGRAQLAGSFLHDRIQYSGGFASVDVVNGVDGDSPFRDNSIQGRVTFHLSPSVRLIARLYAGDSFTKPKTSPSTIGDLPAAGIIDAVPLSDAQLRLYEAGTPAEQLVAGSATFIPSTDNPDWTRAARFLDGALILNGQLSPHFDYSASYQILSNSRRYGDGPAGVDFQPLASTRSIYDGRIQTANAQMNYRAGFNLLSAGYEFESESYANDNTDASNALATSGVNITQRSNALFVQDQVRLFGDRLQLSGAFRAQYFTLDRPIFSPLAAAPFQGSAFPSPPAAYTGDGSAAYLFRKTGTKIRGHVGRGYRAPSLYERFGTGYDPTFGYSVFGSPGLKPERAIAFDAGVDQTLLGGRARISASYFYTSLQQVIIFDVTELFGYRNTLGGLSRGVEVSGTISPTRSMQISAAYTYVNAAERTAVDGVFRMFAVPRNQFSLFATQQVGRRVLLTLDTLVSGTYLAPIFGFSTRVYQFDGPQRLNVGASYRLPLAESRAVRFFARAENITGQRYFEQGFVTPGRTGIGGVQFEF